MNKKDLVKIYKDKSKMENARDALADINDFIETLKKAILKDGTV